VCGWGWTDVDQNECSLFLIAGYVSVVNCAGCPRQQDQSQGQIFYKSAADADQKKTLLLTDFQPVPMLHAPVHNVDHAKYIHRTARSCLQAPCSKRRPKLRYFAALFQLVGRYQIRDLASR
jgi:hypothetical protein